MAVSVLQPNVEKQCLLCFVFNCKQCSLYLLRNTFPQFPHKDINMHFFLRPSYWLSEIKNFDVMQLPVNILFSTVYALGKKFSKKLPRNFFLPF